MARSAVCTSPPYHRGAPRLGDGTTSLCHLHHFAGPYHPLAWFFLSLCYADDTQLFLSFPPEDTTVSARISDCLADISTRMKNHHLQLNLAKTELMVFPAKQAIHHNISINIDSLSLVPSKTARNLGVIIDDQLTFTD